MKSLLPSLKEKKRYVVFEVVSKKGIIFNDVKEEINKSLLRFLGELDMAKAGIQFLDDWKDHKGIIRVNNHYTDKLKSSLALVEKINNNEVIIHTKGVSGILNKARKKFM